MSPAARGLCAAGPLLLSWAACAPAASQAAPGLGGQPVTTLAWVGEDAVRGLKVVVEALPDAAEPEAAVLSTEAPLLRALALRDDEGILQVHGFGAAAQGELAALTWPDGSRMEPARPREDADARARLLYEAAGAGGAHAMPDSMPAARRDHLVVGRIRADAEAVLTWSGAAGSLRLAPRRWTAAERLAVLTSTAPAPAESSHPEAAHD